MDDVWDGLKLGDGRRVNATGRFDFFWCVLEKGNAALVLFLPSDVEVLRKLPKFKSLEVAFRQLERTAFVIRLTDDTQRALFRTLCEDVVLAAEAGADLDDAVERAIRRTCRWSYLMRSGSMKSLTTEEQRGLLGEVTFLEELVSSLGSAAALEAWKGPEGTSKDFEFPSLYVEIKSRRGAAKPYVKISSVDQLSDVRGAELYLRVYDIDGAVVPEGETLHDVMARVEQFFVNDLGQFGRWQELLAMTGYDPDDDYTGRRWCLGKVRTFRVASGFPRVTPPQPLGVNNLTYTVALDACEAYACETVDFSPLFGDTQHE